MAKVSPLSYIYVFIGGGIGSAFRFALSRWFGLENHLWPWPTLAANTLACAFLAWGLSAFGRTYLTEEAHRLLLLTGFCGGFSTFSTFSAEVLQLWHLGQPWAALAYTLLSLVLGWGVFLAFS